MKEEIIAAEQAAAFPKSVSETGAGSTGSSAAGAAVALVSRIGRLRWSICGLLFFATTINYVDRQVIGILSKDLQVAFHWTEIDYGNIVAAFNAAYALGLLFAGRLMDRFGTKVGYTVALTIWSSCCVLLVKLRPSALPGAQKPRHIASVSRHSARKGTPSCSSCKLSASAMCALCRTSP